MKIFKNTKYIISAIAILLTIGCSDSKLSTIKNGVFIQEAAPNNRYNQQIEKLTIESETIQNLTIRLANYINSNVNVRLEVDNEFLEKYNSEHGTNYQVLPEEYLSFDRDLTIAAGDVSAPLLDINIKSYKTPNGEAYAIPIKIASVDGPVDVVGNASRILYLLSSPHKQSTPILTGANRDSKVQFKNTIATPNWTVEYWMRMNSTPYGASNNYVFADNASPISFNTETSSILFLRFWKIGALLQGPCYQCQMSGTYFDDNTEAWKPNVWYHIAYTYDGSKVQMYIDGEANASKELSKDFEFSSVVFCGNFNSSYPIAQFSQIRIWDACLQSSSIKDGMSRQVKTDSKGLIGYWKCDEGEGNVLKDSSINGNDITLRRSVEWSEEYNFSNPNKK